VLSNFVNIITSWNLLTLCQEMFTYPIICLRHFVMRIPNFYGLFAIFRLWREPVFAFVLQHIMLDSCWSSSLRPRPRNQRSRVQIPVVNRGFCDEQLQCSQSWLFIICTRNYQCDFYVYDLCMFHYQPINVPTAGAQAFLMD
jgi:hypothetical protein